MATPFNYCPICCERDCKQAPAADGMTDLECPNCGIHRLAEDAAAELEVPTTLVIDDFDPQRGRLGFAVRKLPAHTVVTLAMLVEFDDGVTLPEPLARIDCLVVHLANAYPPGHSLYIKASSLRAAVGAESTGIACWVLQQAQHLGLIGGDKIGYNNEGLSLSAAGWERYGRLLRDGAGSRHAFMAMKFGDAELDSVFRDHLCPAVAAAGFELRTTAGDHKTAGSIDNRMRVEIRTSRFLVCDLTHGNRGAYWEAGFAEGLGRPVFYICRADVLTDKTHTDHPHFDTAHQLIIAWNPADPSPGMKELKDAIRATLPAEAKMEDRDHPGRVR